MKMKEEAINAAIDGMIDAGLKLPRDAVRARIDAIYKEQGLEFQQVFDALLESELGHIAPKTPRPGPGYPGVPQGQDLRAQDLPARPAHAARAHQARHSALGRFGCAA